MPVVARPVSAEGRFGGGLLAFRFGVMFGAGFHRQARDSGVVGIIDINAVCFRHCAEAHFQPDGALRLVAFGMTERP